MKSILKVIGLMLVTNLMITFAGISPAAAGMNLSPKQGALSKSGQDKKTDASAQAKAESAYAELPMCFEANQGQTDASVKYLARGRGYTLFLTSSEAVLALQTPAVSQVQGQDVVRMRLQGANADPTVQGLERLPSQSNYLTGNDPRQWHSHVAQYSKVAYKQVYPGIDVVYYGNQRQLEYDFVVAPGANPGLIRMDFSGAKSLELDQQGNLVLSLKGGRLAFNAPLLYQKTGDARKPVEGRFVLASNKQVGFEVGAYDKNKELVIDPAMSYVYATYLGGTVDDSVNAMAVAANGTVYLTGFTVSGSFPGTEVGGVFDSSIGTGQDAFVTKISPAGLILWSTYLGGDGIDIGNAIAVDGSGIVYITGETTSTDFPTAGPQSRSGFGGGSNTEAFVTAIRADGTGPLVYSTYLGGAGPDMGYGIAVDALGTAYVTGGTSSNETTFPQTAGAYKTTHAAAQSDVFVSRFDPSGNRVYSTFIGGAAEDVGRAITIDGIGNAYITGQAAPDFYVDGTFPNGFKPTITSGLDAFIVKMDPALTGLLYVSYIGGAGIDMGTGIALDYLNDVYITGWTESGDFPGAGVVPVGQQDAGTTDAYVFKLRTASTGATDCVYSTYLGGSGLDEATAIKVDLAGNAYVTGITESPDFVSLAPFNPADTPPLGNGLRGGTSDAFVSVVSPLGDTRLFKTYLGGATLEGGKGIGLDAANNIYVAGWTTSLGVYPAGFPTAGSAPMPRQTDSAGAQDGFVVKISATSPALLPAITGLNPTLGPTIGGTTVVITGSGFNGVNGVTGVKFGALNATSYIVNSNTQITAIAPAQTARIVDVVVTSPVGSSPLVSEDRYTYFLAPTSDASPYIFPSPNKGSAASIAYYMAGPGLVNIRVYNEIGDLVDAVEERKPAGSQGSSINVGKLAPGVYFCILKINYDDGTTKKYSKNKFVVIH